MSDIFVFGAGGHAKVILDILENQKLYKIKAIIDREVRSPKFMGYEVISQNDFARSGIKSGVIAIGDNWARHVVEQEILQVLPEFKFISAIHPRAIVSAHAQLAPGSVVMAGAVINPGTKVGRHCVVNTRASIDHDCVLEEFSSVAPGCTLGGTVTIGKFSAIGIGATISHGLSVGEHTVVGAGSVVVKPIQSKIVAYGSPCRDIRERAAGEKYL